MEYYSKIIAKINQFLNRNSETYKGLLRAATMGRKGSVLRSSESFSLCANSKETARQRRKDYSGSQLWSITVGRGGQSAAKNIEVARKEREGGTGEGERETVPWWASSSSSHSLQSAWPYILQGVRKIPGNRQTRVLHG